MNFRLLLAVLAAGLVTLACRAAPFALLRSGNLPPLLDYLQRYLPPVVMTILVANSFASLLSLPPQALPGPALALLLPGALAAALQLWRGNALLSIIGATGLHMLLARLA